MRGENIRFSRAPVAKFSFQDRGVSAPQIPRLDQGIIAICPPPGDDDAKARIRQHIILFNLRVGRLWYHSQQRRNPVVSAGRVRGHFGIGARTTSTTACDRWRCRHQQRRLQTFSERSAATRTSRWEWIYCVRVHGDNPWHHRDPMKLEPYLTP